MWEKFNIRMKVKPLIVLPILFIAYLDTLIKEVKKMGMSNFDGGTIVHSDNLVC